MSKRVLLVLAFTLMFSTWSSPATRNCAVLNGTQISSSGFLQPDDPFDSSTPMTSNEIERI